MPTPITIYTKPFCPYCTRALALFQSMGLAVEQIEAESDPAIRAYMIERSGGRTTYPQIFVGDVHVGGSDELMELDRNGLLPTMLEITRVQ